MNLAIKTTQRLGGIESLRAYAAVAIILFHLAGVGKVYVPSAISFINTHFGFGVPLFFVVSAFSLAYGYHGKLHTEGALNNYFVSRIMRIAPLFYLMLVAQLVHIRIAENVTYAPLDVLINALFLFNFVPHLVEGIVPASWTIGVEMLFYVAFPVALLFASNLTRALCLLAAAVIVATQFSFDMKPALEVVPSFIYHNFITNLPYFCWGLIGFYLFRMINSLTSYRRQITWVLCGLSVAAILTLYNSSTIYMFFWQRGLRTTWDTLWGIPFALLCIGLAIHPTRVLSNAVTQFMGKVSFSLYLVHPTIIYYLGKSGFYDGIYKAAQNNAAAGFAACAAITIALVTAISYVTYKYIEVPGMNLGKYLTRKPVAGFVPGSAASAVS